MKHGFIKIVKPKGWSSYDVVAKTKKHLQCKRVGHCGTLDPLASGLMIVAVGEATKLLPYLDKSNKTYTATIELGKTSSTYDLEGEIQENNKPLPNEQRVQEAIQNFQGVYDQVPPIWSALKLDGKKLYEYARSKQSIDLSIKKRSVDIIRIKGEFRSPYIDCTCTVSSGTYIRSLAHDIGKYLGCGGYITALHRTHINTIDESHAWDIDNNDCNILSPSEILAFPIIEINNNDLNELQHGRQITIKEKQDGIYILRHNNTEIGIVHLENERVIKMKILQI